MKMGRLHGSWPRLSEKISLQKAKGFAHCFAMLVICDLAFFYPRERWGPDQLPLQDLPYASGSISLPTIPHWTQIPGQALSVLCVFMCTRPSHTGSHPVLIKFSARSFLNPLLLWELQCCAICLSGTSLLTFLGTGEWWYSHHGTYYVLEQWRRRRQRLEQWDCKQQEGFINQQSGQELWASKTQHTHPQPALKGVLSFFIDSGLSLSQVVCGLTSLCLGTHPLHGPVW